jgi:hypothetical protein
MQPRFGLHLRRRARNPLAPVTRARRRRVWSQGKNRRLALGDRLRRRHWSLDHRRRHRRALSRSRRQLGLALEAVHDQHHQQCNGGRHWEDACRTTGKKFPRGRYESREGDILESPTEGASRAPGATQKWRPPPKVLQLGLAPVALAKVDFHGGALREGELAIEEREEAPVRVVAIHRRMPSAVTSGTPRPRASCSTCPRIGPNPDDVKPFDAPSCN